MSAGVCIMNKNAIALAADSAVTIGNHKTIFNSANKLFALSDKAPIGAIIYSNVEMQYIPMEIILKQFKLYLGDIVFPELKDYFNSFIKFLLEKENLFHFNNTESAFVKGIYISLLNGLKNDYESEIKSKIEEKGKNLTQKELIAIARKVTKQTIDYVEMLPNNKNVSLSSYISKTYSTDIADYISANFTWIADDMRTDLINSVCKVFDKVFYRAGFVGLAFAGYGEDDIFPKMLHINISGIINHQVVYTIIEEVCLSEINTAAITPLAQKDVMQTFLYGINDELINALKMDIPQQITTAFTGIDSSFFADNKKNEVENTIVAAAGPIIQNIIYTAQRNYMIPMINSVAILPVEELSLLAESMIHITSIRRKVALDDNVGTVGGPIDIAIITKADGFQWLRQKSISK